MTKTIDELNQITREVIGAAIEVHRQLGPGYVERFWVTKHHKQQ